MKIASFCHDIGTRLHLEEETICFLPLVWLDKQPGESDVTRIADEVVKVHGCILGVNYKSISPPLVRACHSANTRPMAWTVDDETQIRSMVEIGVNAIASNRLDVFVRVLHQTATDPRTPIVT